MSEIKHTPGPWIVSGVRIKMDSGEWHGIARYDEANKRDETLACVGYDPRTGQGMADARLICAAPELLEAVKNLIGHARFVEANFDISYAHIHEAEDALSKAEGRR